MNEAVVIFDEEDRVARALARELAGLGVQPIIVTDLSGVRAALEAHAPRLFIADLWSGERSGLAALEMARRDFPAVGRCLLTGSIHGLDSHQLERIRPCSVLPKPWTVAELTVLLSRAS
ncbi:MAG: hypothetical protein ACOZQL_19450 [Myxococcota bacterium]